MKPGNVLDLRGVKLYFPFFRGKDQVPRSMVSEAEWLIAYLLVCDVIVIPPREFLRPENLSSTFTTISRQNLLHSLFLRGDIVITSPMASIRDVRDLIEYYDPGTHMPKYLTDLTIFERDEMYQRTVYTEHLKEHLRVAAYYGDADREELIRFLDTKPNHPTVSRKLGSIREHLEPGSFERIRLEALDSYFLAGALGNGAIMPPSRVRERSHLYNAFYSKDAVGCFKRRVEGLVGRSLRYLSPDLFETLRNSLVPFRRQYFELSLKYQHSYARLSALFSQSRARVELPFTIAYASAATAIASVAATVISRDVFTFTGTLLGVRFLWQYLARVTDITNALSRKITKLLSEVGLLAPYRSQVADILGSLETSVIMAMKR